MDGNEPIVKTLVAGYIANNEKTSFFRMLLRTLAKKRTMSEPLTKA
jgi:hypothetical protein